jgi:hypothetical protein
MASVSLIEDNSLRALDNGYEVQIRLLWYRSLPVSCIENIHLSLDGQPVDQSLLRFGINDRQFQVSELEDLIEEFWFVQDSARLIALQPGKVTSGETHNVEVELTLRFPYIPIGPGKFLSNTNKYSVTQVAR